MFIFIALFVVSAVSAAPSATPLITGQTIYTAAPLLSQYHSQDDLGQYSYGYSGGLSSKTETKTLDGITRGSYSYVDAEGRLQSVEYTADAMNGFRAAATNLPKAPIDTNIAPAPIALTPEVERATAEHMAAFNEIANNRRTVEIAAAAEEETQPSSAIVVETASAAAAKSIEATPTAFIATDAASSAAIPITPFAHHFIASPAATYTYKAADHPSAAFSYSYNTAPLAYYSAAPPAQYFAPAALPLMAHNFAFAQPTFFARSAEAMPAAAAINFEPAQPNSDTEEVAAARAEHFAAVEEQKARIAAASEQH